MASRPGNTEAGDDPRFKGRGYIQLTGRDNYRRVGSQIGINLIDQPQSANDLTIAGPSSLSFSGTRNQQSGRPWRTMTC